MPISSLVVTFHSPVEDHSDSLEALRSIPEIELGPSGGSRLAIVVDSADRQRDQEIWNAVRDLPGVLDLAVVMVALDEDRPTEINKSTRNQR